MPVERPSIRADALGHRRRRVVQLGLLGTADPRRERGPRRSARARLAVELRHLADAAGAHRLVQAAALALAARNRGAERLVILRVQDSAYAADIASAVARSARRLHLSVVQTRSWDERKRSYAELARHVRRSRPDAVVLAGWIGANGGRLIRDLRRELGGSVVLLGTDGFTQGNEVIAAAGPAAEGMLATVPGVPSDRMGPAGRRFVKHVERAAPAWLALNHYWIPFAAQATEVLLDAIAASDGTRASVIASLHSPRSKGSVIGAMRFDRNGDPEPAMPVTILRIHRGGAGMTSGARDFADGTIVDRVVTPPRSLYRP
jgi:ABC-type branched-subunit amino acid transport system substrate-binding protein